MVDKTDERKGKDTTDLTPEEKGTVKRTKPKRAIQPRQMGNGGIGRRTVRPK